MAKVNWLEEIFPGINKVGFGSDTGGNQAILIEKDNCNYLIFTDGFDYGSWVGKCYELTEEEKKQVVDWESDTYDLQEWLKKK
jgi:hypothetical protein